MSWTFKGEQAFVNINISLEIFCRQVESWKMFQSFYNILGIVHLFWFLFGSINVLPSAIMDGLYLSDQIINDYNCSYPVRFWFCAMVLSLQWLLLVVTLVWYYCHVSPRGEKLDWTHFHDQDSRRTSLTNNSSFYSFPRISSGIQ